MTILYLYARFFCGPWDKVVKAEDGYLFSRENESLEILPGYFVSYWIDNGYESESKSRPKRNLQRSVRDTQGI